MPTGFGVRQSGVNRMLSAAHCGSTGQIANDPTGERMGAVGTDVNATTDEEGRYDLDDWRLEFPEIRFDRLAQDCGFRSASTRGDASEDAPRVRGK